MAGSGEKEDSMLWSPIRAESANMEFSESESNPRIDDSICEADGGEQEGKTLEDPISSDPSSVAADKELSDSESKSRGSLSSIATGPIILFEKTLLYPDSTVLNIPDHVAFSHFPSYARVDHIFDGSEIVNIRDFQDDEDSSNDDEDSSNDDEDSSNGWHMKFFYCPIHSSFALAGDWKDVASYCKMEAGDILYFHKKTHACDASNNIYILPVTKKDDYGCVCLFTKELTQSDVSVGSLLLPNLVGDKFFSWVKNGNGSADKEEDMIHVYDTYKGGKYKGENWLMRISFIHTTDSYLISGDWSEFISAHRLKATDVIWFYKTGGDNENGRRYLIDFVRAEDAGYCRDDCYSLRKKRSRPSEIDGGEGCSTSGQKHG